MAYPRVDFKGFKTEVTNARAIISKSGSVFVLHSPETGFIFRKEICDDLEDMVINKKIVIVGYYKKPLRSPDLVEDLEFVLNGEQAKAA